MMKKSVFFIYSLLISSVLPTQSALAEKYMSSIGMTFVKIEPGCFIMGRNPNYPVEQVS
jgi:hypothetical protein